MPKVTKLEMGIARMWLLVVSSRIWAIIWTNIPFCSPKSPFWNLNGHMFQLVPLNQSWRMILQNHSSLLGEIPQIYIYYTTTFPSLHVIIQPHRTSLSLNWEGFLSLWLYTSPYSSLMWCLSLLTQKTFS